jgi:hypothetical protein
MLMKSFYVDGSFLMMAFLSVMAFSPVTALAPAIAFVPSDSIECAWNPLAEMKWIYLYSSGWYLKSVCLKNRNFFN